MRGQISDSACTIIAIRWKHKGSRICPVAELKAFKDRDRDRECPNVVAINLSSLTVRNGPEYISIAPVFYSSALSSPPNFG
ncbi:hypothetical protein AYI69_g6826 [Smittium culicis]|uniref:Uncharacterized protein n=1 Tax=Smittium culicis TaxID=133412 RepID=A0A1R1WYF3_9FUNG|nr:hypothetical protein AYI69_g11466 [Smittium culicis]OMJ18930.1 hypothetical protein AYI69_g6826 [Smittium culicis]